MKMKIIVDSTFYLIPAFVKENHIDVVPLNIIIDHKSYLDMQDISVDEVMKAFNDGKKVGTSQPSPLAFIEKFSKAEADGYEHILCMTLSSGVSGTFQAAMIAKAEYKGKIEVAVIDTLSAAIGAEMLVDIALLNKEESFHQLVERLEKVKKQIGIYLSMQNLNSLRISGRLNRVKATIGNLLHVKPIVEVAEGVLSINSKMRTERQVLEWMINRIKSDLKNVSTAKYIYVSHIHANERLQRLLQYLEKEFPTIPIKIRDGISSVIAVNIGYGGIGIAWGYE